MFRFLKIIENQALKATKVSDSTMIPFLVILLTIQGVNTMRGDSYSDVQLSEFVVSIWFFHEHRCSGSILDRTHILTAGHCVHDLAISLLSVTAGIIESDPRDIQVVPVQSIHLHPDFRAVCHPTDFRWENDIAVLKLSRKLNWVPTIRAVPLTDVEYNWNACVLCGFFGWDDTAVDGLKLLTLRWSEATVMEDNRCRCLNVSLSTNEKCSRNQFETTVLEDGDYGAPFICGTQAVGITVSGGNRKDDPPIILGIYPYLEFIAEILDVGTVNMPYGNFKHYVAIFHGDIYRCAGSIIDASHILTAAHCVDKITTASLRILPGHREFPVGRISPSQWSSVSSIQIHPDYVYIIGGSTHWTIFRNDIAVVTLQEPLVRSATVSLIPLSANLVVSRRCQVYRWSRTPITGKGTFWKSKWSSVNVWDSDTCTRINPLLGPNRFCTLNLYSLPVATKGDSGSPLVCDGILVGILSSHTLRMRLSCGPYQAMFFTAIFPYLGFIAKAIQN